MSLEGDRPVLSAAEAARAAGVSAKTIARALKAGKVPGAERLPSGGWAVPVEGLLAAGYPLHRSTPEPTLAEVGQAVKAVTVGAEAVLAEVEAMRADVEALERRLADVTRERDVAVAVAAERAEALADVRLALRALSAGSDAEGSAVPPAAAGSPERPVGRPVGRWWRRGR